MKHKLAADNVFITMALMNIIIVLFKPPLQYYYVALPVFSIILLYVIYTFINPLHSRVSLKNNISCFDYNDRIFYVGTTEAFIRYTNENDIVNAQKDLHIESPALYCNKTNTVVNSDLVGYPELFDFIQSEIYGKTSSMEYIRGYLTNKGEFVSHTDALPIAVNARQLIREIPDCSEAVYPNDMWVME